MILLDPEDEWLRNALYWRVVPKGYVEATMYAGDWRKTVKLHHFIVGTPIWEGEEVDHINRDKLDNRRANLRITTRAVNSRNRAFVDKAKHYRVTYAGKYEVRISREGKTIQVGTFATVEEAEAAYAEHTQC